MNSMVYFDPETERDSVDRVRCWGSGFDKWARFTQFGVRFMVKAAFHGHGCRMARDDVFVGRVRLSAPAGISYLVSYHV